MLSQQTLYLPSPLPLWSYGILFLLTLSSTFTAESYNLATNPPPVPHYTRSNDSNTYTSISPKQFVIIQDSRSPKSRTQQIIQLMTYPKNKSRKIFSHRNLLTQFSFTKVPLSYNSTYLNAVRHKTIQDNISLSIDLVKQEVNDKISKDEISKFTESTDLTNPSESVGILNDLSKYNKRISIRRDRIKSSRNISSEAINVERGSKFEKLHDFKFKRPSRFGRRHKHSDTNTLNVKRVRRSVLFNSKSNDNLRSERNYRLANYSQKYHGSRTISKKDDTKSAAVSDVQEIPIVVSLSRSLLSEEFETLECANATDDLQWLVFCNGSELSSNDSFSSGNCTEWDGGQSTLFQIGNLLHLVAFLVPPNFNASALVVRSALSGAMVLLCAWAAVYLCAMDVLVWCSVLCVVNMLHALRLVHVLWPVKIPMELQDLYNKLFKPLKVTRVQFLQLVREGGMEELLSGHSYAEEEDTPAAGRLAVLLKGRLSVSCDSTHLHYIFPNQFVDSPEWEAAKQGGNKARELFQVTVLAEEDSVLLVWQTDKLMQLLQEKYSMAQVLQGLIGKDITTKLYSLTEQQQQVHHSSSPLLLLPGDQNLRATRSHSADALHTGNMGLVRSSTWRSDPEQASNLRRPSQQDTFSKVLIGKHSPNGVGNRVPMVPVHSSSLVSQSQASSYDTGQSSFNVSNPVESEQTNQQGVMNSGSTVINSTNIAADVCDINSVASQIQQDTKELPRRKNSSNYNGRVGEASRGRKRSSNSVRLVTETSNVPTSRDDDTNVSSYFSHADLDASTLNLLDDPDLLETAV